MKGKEVLEVSLEKEGLQGRMVLQASEGSRACQGLMASRVLLDRKVVLDTRDPRVLWVSLAREARLVLLGPRATEGTLAHPGLRATLANKVTGGFKE